MKKLVALGFIVVGLVSCSSKEEDMLREYVNENLKNTINVQVDDVDFKVNSVKQVGTITAKDSVEYFKRKLLSSYYGVDDARVKNLNDTLTYGFVRKVLNDIQESTKNIIKMNRELDREYENYQLEEDVKKYSKYAIDIAIWEVMSDKYSKKADSVLAYKYDVSYSLKNPMMNNVKQTFEKTLYTNKENTKFVGSLEEEK